MPRILSKESAVSPINGLGENGDPHTAERNYIPRNTMKTKLVQEITLGNCYSHDQMKSPIGCFKIKSNETILGEFDITR